MTNGAALWLPPIPVVISHPTHLHETHALSVRWHWFNCFTDITKNQKLVAVRYLIIWIQADWLRLAYSTSVSHRSFIHFVIVSHDQFYSSWYVIDGLTMHLLILTLILILFFFHRQFLQFSDGIKIDEGSRGKPYNIEEIHISKR